MQQANLIHELQHHVQRAEGFTGGGSQQGALGAVRQHLANLANNPDLSPVQEDKLMEATGHVSPGVRRDVNWEMYKRIPGEVEARNAANRFSQGKFGAALPPVPGYDPYRHSKYPWASEDVPRLLQYDYLQRGMK